MKFRCKKDVKCYHGIILSTGVKSGLAINNSVFNHILWDLLNTKLINKQKLYLIKGRGGNGEEVLQKKKLFQHLIRCFPCSFVLSLIFKF